MNPNIFVTYYGTIDTAYYTRDLLSIPNDHAEIARRAVKEYTATKKRIPKQIMVIIGLMGDAKVRRAHWRDFDN
jgi:hypothetical protein